MAAIPWQRPDVEAQSTELRPSWMEDPAHVCNSTRQPGRFGLVHFWPLALMNRTCDCIRICHQGESVFKCLQATKSKLVLLQELARDLLNAPPSSWHLQCVHLLLPPAPFEPARTPTLLSSSSSRPAMDSPTDEPYSSEAEVPSCMPKVPCSMYSKEE